MPPAVGKGQPQRALDPGVGGLLCVAGLVSERAEENSAVKRPKYFEATGATLWDP